MTRTVYAVWSMSPLVSPNEAEIVPNVSPVDMSRVVQAGEEGRTLPRTGDEAGVVQRTISRAPEAQSPRTAMQSRVISPSRAIQTPSIRRVSADTIAGRIQCRPSGEHRANAPCKRHDAPSRYDHRGDEARRLIAR